MFSDKVQLFIYIFTFFYFNSLISWDGKVYCLTCLFLLVDYHLVCLLDEIWQFIFVAKFKRIFFISFSRTNSGLCMYHLSVGSNFISFAQFQVVHFSNFLLMSADLSFLKGMFSLENKTKLHGAGSIKYEVCCTCTILCFTKSI